MRPFLKLTLIITVLTLFVVPALAQDSIAPGDSVDGSLTASDPSQTYTLAAEAGQAVTISLSSDDFDTYLSLLDDSGSVLAENDDNNGTDSAIVGFVLPQAAGYSILVESYGQHHDSGAEQGDYTLSVTELQVERIEYSQTINGQLTTAEPAIDYVFTGQAGDVIVTATAAN
jgi:hypothetical protein